jgi:hypothetical protein
MMNLTSDENMVGFSPGIWTVIELAPRAIGRVQSVGIQPDIPPFCFLTSTASPCSISVALCLNVSRSRVLKTLMFGLVCDGSETQEM